MAKRSEVILRAEVEDLGHAGDVVEVAPGYARNYLLPRGLAYIATEANKQRVAQEKKRYEEKLEQERAEALALATKLEGIVLEFRAMAGEEGQLYGSVAVADIADRLEGLGFEVDRSQIKLDHPIKALGEYEVPLRLHPRVTQPIGVRVEREEGCAVPHDGVAPPRMHSGCGSRRSRRRSSRPRDAPRPSKRCAQSCAASARRRPPSGRSTCSRSRMNWPA